MAKSIETIESYRGQIVLCGDKKAEGNLPMSGKIRSMTGKGVNAVCSGRPSTLTCA